MAALYAVPYLSVQNIEARFHLQLAKYFLAVADESPYAA